MNKEFISDKQGIYMVTMYVLGTATILIRGIEAKQDAWIVILLALVISLVMAFIYSKIHNIFPNKDLFDILEICFGKIIGKIISIAYVWYAFHLATLIVTDFGYFITNVSLYNTPYIIPNIVAGILGMYIVKKGIDVISSWIEFFLPIVFGLIIILIVLAIPEMDINNIKPVLSNGIKPIVQGTLSVFTFPFGEIIIFTMIFKKFETNKSPYKIYSIGLLISAVIFILLGITYILVLGVNRASVTYFPASVVASRLSAGIYLERMEIISNSTSILSTFVKLAICILATSKGIAKILGYKDYKFIVVPITLLMINLSYFLHENIMEYNIWGSEIYSYYALPFIVFFPIIILVVGEVKKHILRIHQKCQLTTLSKVVNWHFW